MAEAKHTHVWELFSQTGDQMEVPDVDAGGTKLVPLEDAPVGVLHAHLPVGHPEHQGTASGAAHDPDNKEHVKALKDPAGRGVGGVENFDPPPPRVPQDVYVCECGEARHVAPGGDPNEVDS